MEDKNPRVINGLIGILGVILIILSIILFTIENAGTMFKSVITVILQVDMGLLLMIYGIKENRSKGKPKGNIYFIVGLAVLTSTVYTIYNLYTKLAQ